MEPCCAAHVNVIRPAAQRDRALLTSSSAVTRRPSERADDISEVTVGASGGTTSKLEIRHPTIPTGWSDLHANFRNYRSTARCHEHLSRTSSSSATWCIRSCCRAWAVACLPAVLSPLRKASAEASRGTSKAGSAAPTVATALRAASIRQCRCEHRQPQVGEAAHEKRTKTRWVPSCHGRAMV